MSVCLYSSPVRVSRAVGKRVSVAPAGNRHASAKDGGLTSPMAPATATTSVCPPWTAATTTRQRAQVGVATVEQLIYHFIWSVN